MKKKYVELVFYSPDHLRAILTELFLNQVEKTVKKFENGVEYFDIELSFRAVHSTFYTKEELENFTIEELEELAEQSGISYNEILKEKKELLRAGYDSATENSKKPSQSFPSFPIRDGRKLN